MSADEFTPTTDQVRDAYVRDFDDDGGRGDFDRWLGAHDETLKGELVETVAEALRSCAGCQYGATDGRLQECYQHGEQAAKYYLDHAIGAMYHFAGIEPPAPEVEA